MTLTVELTGRFHWIPWADFLWNNNEEENNDKVLAFGWGPLQIYLTNFSPIIGGYRWRAMCSILTDHNDKAMKVMTTLSTMEGISIGDVEHVTKQIKEQLVPKRGDNLE